MNPKTTEAGTLPDVDQYDAPTEEKTTQGKLGESRTTSSRIVLLILLLGVLLAGSEGRIEYISHGYINSIILPLKAFFFVPEESVAGKLGQLLMLLPPSFTLISTYLYLRSNRALYRRISGVAFFISWVAWSLEAAFLSYFPGV